MKTSQLVPLILAGSLAVSLSAFAAKGAPYTAPVAANDSYYHSGFYLGGAIGGNQYVSSLDQQLSAVILEPFSGEPLALGNNAQEYETKSAGFTGQLQLGYAYLNDWFFGAIEISGNGATGSNIERDYETVTFFEGSTFALNSDTKVELNSFEPVVDLKIGFKVTSNSLLYARVGAAFNSLEVSENTTFSETFPFLTDTPLTSTLHVSESNSVVGLRLGLGGEHRFTENLAVTLDYIYTDYGDADVSGVADTAYFGPECPDYICVGPDGLAASDEVNVKRNVVMMGMNYYF